MAESPEAVGGEPKKKQAESSEHPSEVVSSAIPNDVTGPYAPPELGDSAAELSRYERGEREGRSYLVCQDAPRLLLYVERGLLVAEGSRKKYPRQSIFLDGAYDGPPFLDNEARQYSLDHHGGCVRSYTLATCEQAAVLLAQGLPLGEGTWHLYVNGPDLDAVLAAWLLMNHVELTRDEAIFADVMPFVRVEGTIDAHGFDKPLLSGLPLPVFDLHKKHIDELLAEERQLKQEGRWGQCDWLDYTQSLLRRLDQRLYPPGHLSNLVEITELAQAPLAGGKLAVLCSSRQGIYAVEQHLKKRYEKQLAVIVLYAGSGTFTLRQTDPFQQKTLEAVYAALDKRDPAVSTAAPDSGEGNPGDTANHWGGSADIGGSPRATGSKLSGEDVLRVVQQVYGGGWLQRMVRKITRIGHG